jgi:hypothetical protein
LEEYVINLVVGWVWILLGFAAGAVSGLLFHDEGWLGGYASWPRRMVRLAHVAFFGMAFVNLAFAVTCRELPSSPALRLSSALFIAGAVGMPVVCYLAAWRKPLRHLFPLPVTCLVLGAVLVIVKLLGL